MLVSMSNILHSAKNGHYAIGSFNTVTFEMAQAVIGAAEELHSPIIVGTAEVLLRRNSLSSVMGFLLPMAESSSVPVCIHFDHGLSLDKCIESLNLGFTSIMYDCSTMSYEDNILKLSQMAKLCHKLGCSIEGELGHVGDNYGSGKLVKSTEYFTDPDVALDYVQRTNVDALAIAVGNAHGDYQFPPHLDFERIETISKLIDIPLVLHGGSGISDLDFRRAIELGVCKINIFTDIDKARSNGVNAMKELVMHKLKVFGSINTI